MLHELTIRQSGQWLRTDRALIRRGRISAGGPESIDRLTDELTDVCEHYICARAGAISGPDGGAEFQLRAETEFRCTRIDGDEARYKVSNQYISTALLFDEAGETGSAVAFLEKVRDELSRLWAASDPVMAKRKFGQLDRLLGHLRNKTAVAEPSI